MLRHCQFAAASLMLLGSLVMSSDRGQAAAGLFSGMAGYWSGGGTLSTAAGQERLRCRATYAVDGSGDALQLNLRCASDSYNFDLAGDVAHRGGAISGSWSEATRNIGGKVSGRASGDTMQVVASGGNFTASLSLTTRGNRQAVSIRSQGSDISGVSVTLARQ